MTMAVDKAEIRNNLFMLIGLLYPSRRLLLFKLPSLRGINFNDETKLHILSKSQAIGSSLMDMGAGGKFAPTWAIFAPDNTSICTFLYLEQTTLLIFNHLRL